MGGSAAKDAAKQQAEAQKWIFRQQTKLNQPYMYAGNAALNPLFALYGIDAGLATGAGAAGASGMTPEELRAGAMDMFYASPEYTLQKGALDQALMRQAAATGTRYSPSTALGQAEIAGRVFGDWRNNLGSLAQMGPNAANQQGSNLANLGAGLSQAYGNLGNARAGMYGALGQSIADIGGMVNQYGQYNQQMDALKQLYGGGMDNAGYSARWGAAADAPMPAMGINF